MIALADGRVFVNDSAARQVVLLDAKLTNPRIVLDSAAGHDNSYGARPGLLLPFRGDSVLFWPLGAGSPFLVIAPDGAIHRQFAAPTVPTSSFTMLPVTFSPTRGLIYTIAIPPTLQLTLDKFPTLAPGQTDTVLVRPDSLRLMAMDLETRHADTLTQILSGNQISRRFSQAQRGGGGSSSPALYSFVDDVVAGSDGALAILHALDYRVDWIGADRTGPASPRIPYDWRRVSDAERTRLLDSINGARNERYAPTLAKWIADSASGQPQRMAPPLPVNLANMAARGMTPPPQRPLPRPPPPTLVQPSDIPDYLPPVGRRSMQADMDGHVWILPIVRVSPGTPAATPSAATWDVVDRRGALVQRVTIPANARLVGFAPGKAILVGGTPGAQTLQEVPIR